VHIKKIVAPGWRATAGAIDFGQCLVSAPQQWRYSLDRIAYFLHSY